jgi:threonine dehydrogenase-like Zn-dependent dehydrogenase
MTDRVYKLADNVSFENAAFAHISIFPLAAIRKCRFEIGESAIVMGLGVLGLFAVKLLQVAGAAPIIAVDPDPKKREKALSIGADYALDPYAADFAETAKRLTNGGANVGIEVTGIGAGLDGILDCMAKFGRVALLGCTRNKEFNIDYYLKVHCPGITLVGAHTNARPENNSSGGWWTQADDMKAILKLIEMGRLDLASVRDEVYSPLEAPAVYKRLVEQPSFPVAQFDWRLLK